METIATNASTLAIPVVKAMGEEPSFKIGDAVRISVRFPVGHYRVPTYVRGKRGTVTAIPYAGINNEDEGFGKNAGVKAYYYRLSILLTELWPGYMGGASDRLELEVFETWLEKI
jgi:nitrile hydratase subunit beta